MAQPLRLLAYAIAAEVGVLDAEEVLALPMRQIQEWVSFFRIREKEANTKRGSKRAHLTDPEKLREAFAKAYGR